MDWVARDRNAIWHPFTPLAGIDDPLMVIKGEGVYLHTADGRKIIDAVSSWWVNLHGHGHPYIAEKVSEQVRQLEHVIFAGFTHQPAVELAENLLSILPANQAKIFYSDNGSTAVEVALKMAFQYWYNQGIPKKRVIAIDGAYHGDTFGSMSVGERGDFTRPFMPFLFDVDYVDFPWRGREDEVLGQFQKLVEQGDVAAFIFEPLVQGASGMRVYSPQFLDRLISICKENEVLCIADEVMTGFGRTGKLFASDHLTHKPDILCLSKGLTGGTMALGVTSCTVEVMEVYRSAQLKKAFLHGHSFTANPIACAAANASFELLMKKECQQAIQWLSETQAQFVSKNRSRAILNDIRSLGTILALEFKTDHDSSYFSEMRNTLYPFFLERNILLRPLGNLIYVLPPYVINAEQLGQVHSAIEEFLDTCK